MRWFAVELREGALFNDLAGFHYEDAIGETGLNFGRVADQQKRELHFALQVAQQFDEFRLAYGVEGGGRLVGDDQGGTAGERLREDNALALAAAQLVRVGGENAARFP